MKILEKNKEIIKVLFFLNALVSVISLFFFEKWMIFTLLIINVMLLGVSLIIHKYSFMLEGLIRANSFAKKLNDKLN